MMQYREPINLGDIVTELRRLWMVPLAAAVAFALVFVALQARSAASFEQRVDVVGSDIGAFATGLGAPVVVEKFDADAVAKREQSKVEVLNRESAKDEQLRVQGVAVTSTVSIFASAPSPEAALELAKRYAGDVVDAQRSVAAQRIGAARDALQGELTSLQSELDTPGNESDSDRVVLLVDRAATIKLLTALSALEKGGDGGVSDPQVIGSPDEIRRSSLGTYTVLGALLGLVLGCAFVALRRTLSSAVFAEADLARYGSTVPVLADITGTDVTAKGVFAALASACEQSAVPGRLLGVLICGVDANTVPSELTAGLLEALPALGMTGSVSPPNAVPSLESVPADGTFHIVVDDDGIRESSSAIAGAGRLASTMVVVRRRKTSVAMALEAIELIHQADGQLRGIVIVD